MASTTSLLLRLTPPHHHRTSFLHLQPPSIHLPHSFPPKPLKSSTTTKITATYTPTPVTDRLISAASYFLPLFNSLQYGRFLFTKFPPLAAPFEPLLPLLGLYHSIPSASFVTFFAFYLGVVRNTSLSKYVRFNAMQALVLDVLLVVPVLLAKVISPGRSGIVVKATAVAHSGLFVFVVGCFLYGLVSSVLGKTPYLPIVAQAAGRQLEGGDEY